eukprot:1138077-Pelagomonas_calceolata.AAC.1
MPTSAASTLQRVAIAASGVAGAECSLFPPRPPLLLNGNWELVLGTLFIETTDIASGRLEDVMEFTCKLACSLERKGKGYIAVPACRGSLAVAKMAPVNKPVQS